MANYTRILVFISTPFYAARGVFYPMALIPQNASCTHDEIRPFCDHRGPALNPRTSLVRPLAIGPADGFLVDLYVGDSLQVVCVRCVLKN